MWVSICVIFDTSGSVMSELLPPTCTAYICIHQDFQGKEISHWSCGWLKNSNMIWYNERKAGESKDEIPFSNNSQQSFSRTRMLTVLWICVWQSPSTLSERSVRANSRRFSSVIQKAALTQTAASACITENTWSPWTWSPVLEKRRVLGSQVWGTWWLASVMKTALPSDSAHETNILISLFTIWCVMDPESFLWVFMLFILLHLSLTFDMWLKQTFTEADKNGDGSLSISEVLQLLHKLNVNLPRQKVKQMFKVPKPLHSLCLLKPLCRWLKWKFYDAKLKLFWKGVWRFSCCLKFLTKPIYSLILNNACEPNFRPL